MLVTVKPKIPESSAKNQMVQHFYGNYIPKFRFTLFLVFETGSRKIVYHLIISSFSSLLRVRGIKVTSAILIKKKSENGLKMIDDTLFWLAKPSSLLSVHPNRFFGAKFMKKCKFDL